LFDDRQKGGELQLTFSVNPERSARLLADAFGLGEPAFPEGVLRTLHKEAGRKGLTTFSMDFTPIVNWQSRLSKIKTRAAVTIYSLATTWLYVSSSFFPTAYAVG